MLWIISKLRKQRMRNDFYLGTKCWLSEFTRFLFIPVKLYIGRANGVYFETT